MTDQTATLMDYKAISLDQYIRDVEQVELLPWCGVVTATVGLLIESIGPAVAIGDFCEIEGAEVVCDQEDRERESEVADAVYNECFVACVGREFFREVEADQEVTAQADAFPSDEQE